MTTVAEFQAELLAPGTPFKYVKGAAELSALGKGNPTAVPAAYVYVLREASDDNEHSTGDVQQRTERDIAVVYVTKNLSDAIGGAAVTDIEAIKKWSRGQLIGFVPQDVEDGDTSGEPVTHVAGELTELRDGFVWYDDTFSAPFYLNQKDDV